jgi:4-hydroxy-2-oxoheptanedioate aldolase
MPETLHDIVKNTFKEKLATGQIVSTLTVRVFRGVEIARIAKSCGFDALFIDLQHSALSLETTSQLCIAALTAGITPIVRVPGYKPEYVSRVLDGGAMGVLLPHADSPADLEKVVSYSKFPPLGDRSTGGGLPQLQYRSWAETETFKIMNEATMVMAQIETPAAVDRVEEIAGVSGIDAFMVGTNDLCAGFGIAGQHGHELVRQAYVRTIAACGKHQKYVGIGGISNRKLIAEYVGLGARIVATGTDISIMMETGSERAQFVQSLIV